MVYTFNISKTVYLFNRIQSLKYLRYKTLGYKDIRIRKLEFKGSIPLDNLKRIKMKKN